MFRRAVAAGRSGGIAGDQVGHRGAEARFDAPTLPVAAAFDLLRPADPDAVDPDAVGENEMVENLPRRDEGRAREVEADDVRRPARRKAGRDAERLRAALDGAADDVDTVFLVDSDATHRCVSIPNYIGLRVKCLTFRCLAGVSMSSTFASEAANTGRLASHYSVTPRCRGRAGRAEELAGVNRCKPESGSNRRSTIAIGGRGVGVGASTRIRTVDLAITNRSLYQLSYRGARTGPS